MPRFEEGPKPLLSRVCSKCCKEAIHVIIEDGCYVEYCEKCLRYYKREIELTNRYGSIYPTMCNGVIVPSTRARELELDIKYGIVEFADDGTMIHVGPCRAPDDLEKITVAPTGEAV